MGIEVNGQLLPKRDTAGQKTLGYWMNNRDRRLLENELHEPDPWHLCIVRRVTREVMAACGYCGRFAELRGRFAILLDTSLVKPKPVRVTSQGVS